MASAKEVQLRNFNVHKFVGQIGIQGVAQQMNLATCVHKASKLWQIQAGSKTKIDYCKL